MRTNLHNVDGFLYHYLMAIVFYLIQVASLSNDHNQAEAELQLARAKMKECDSQISGILKEQEKLKRKITDASLEKKRMENEVTCCFDSCLHGFRVSLVIDWVLIYFLSMMINR